MNIVFMGTMAFAVPILEGLAERHAVRLVVTQPDRPAGRDRTLTPSAVKRAAQTLGIPVFQPERIRTDHAPVLAAAPDLIVVAAYGQMIPDVVLFAPRFRSINVHASLLPRYRGGAPMHRAILAGDAETGVTVMEMASRMDAGPVYAQSVVAIDEDDDVGSLEAKLAVAGRDLLLAVLPGVFAGTAKPQPQDENLVTFARNLKPEEERLDFRKTMKQVCDHVRAFRPSPTTYAEIGGLKVIFRTVRPVADVPGLLFRPAPGKPVVHKGRLLIGVADGYVEALELVPAGKKPMTGVEFAGGAGRKVLQSGSIFNEQS